MLSNFGIISSSCKEDVGDAVALLVGHRTCDLQVAGSTSIV